MKKTMKAVVTLGQGEYDKLSYQDYDIPEINEHEVLV